MADYTNSSKPPTKVYPENAVETASQHVEPLLSPSQLRLRHLFGLPLVSQIKDPMTGKPQVMTDDMLKDIIEGAVQQVELETRVDIFPVKRAEKYPFDRNLYESFGYFSLEHRPATSIDRLTVTPSNEIDIFEVPLTWVESAYLYRGQVNIIPLTIGFINGGYVQSQSGGGAFFLNILGNKAWIPAYWKITYTSGYPDGNVPRVVNELIGTVAAMEVLSQLAVTYARNQSHSLGIDGLSQSVSTPGPQIFALRLQELEAKRKKIVGKVKALYNRKLFSSHV